MRDGCDRLSMPDCLIVGAGTAGCVLAHRLAAAGADVLLVEAGRASRRLTPADFTMLDFFRIDDG